MTAAPDGLLMIGGVANAEPPYGDERFLGELETITR